MPAEKSRLKMNRK